MTEIINVNYLSVLVAAIASFAFGAIWYGPLFGNRWIAMMGYTAESMKDMKLSPAKAMSLGFVFTLITAFVLAHFADTWEAAGLAGAWELSFWIWLGFLVPILAGSYLWENKPFKLFVFNAAYQLIAIFSMSLIIVFWA